MVRILKTDLASMSSLLSQFLFSHQVTLTARIFQTLSFSHHPSLSSNTPGRSSRLHLVSAQSWYVIYTGWPPQKKKKETEPIYFWLKFINLILAFSFFSRIWSRFCVWKIGKIVFTNMSWSAKENNWNYFALFL